MKFLAKSFLNVVLLASLSFTLYSMPPKPASCPSAASIIAGGLPNIEFDAESGGYIAYQVGRYNTKNLWGFLIADIQAGSVDEAVRIASADLSTLSGTPTPMADTADDLWVCFYATQSGHLAAAITPLDFGARMKRGIMIARQTAQ